MNNNTNFDGEDVKMYIGGGGEAGDDTVPSIISTIKQEDDDIIIMAEREMQWLQKPQQNDLLIDLNDHAGVSVFYHDFPPLPDFPCMSSSSSSSSAPPPPLAAVSISSPSYSSTNASWPQWRSDSSEDNKEIIKTYISTPTQQQMQMDHVPPPAGEINCLNNVMENFGYMDVKDQNDIWDPSSIFQSQEQIMMVAQDSIQQQQQIQQSIQQQQQIQQSQEENGSGGGGGGFSYFLQGNSELSAIFLEWLKQNRDRISAKDLRSIKLKRSTIESASKRLGSGKEGKKQLLKLILQWVEHNQLRKKPKINNPPSPHLFYQHPPQNPNPNPVDFFCCNSVPVLVDLNNPLSPTSSWIHPPPIPYADHSAAAYPAPSIRYACTDPYSNGLGSNNNIVNGNYFPSSTPMMDSSNLETWSDHDVSGNSHAYEVFDANGERLVKPGPLATKEARKKRMARHRRPNAVHHRHLNQQVQNQPHEQCQIWRNCAAADNYPSSQVIDPLVYWSQAAAAAAPPPAPLVSPNFDHEWLEGHPDPPSWRDQGHKTETNLRFLLQKVLKQSDVGSLGRIVLPKKEAELHLPELNSRDGIPITMEDIGTSNVWTMRYRFWPNNKSRMYLLENTGGFVRLNSLQEGDFIVLYSEIKSGKYLIRGVKVRPTESKPECKKTARKGRQATNNLTHAIDCEVK